jgi:hypothetical protein
LRLYLFVILFIATSFGLVAQNLFEKKSFVITYSNVLPESNFKKIFDLLSINNEKNIKKITLKVIADQRITLKNDNLIIDFGNTVVTGDVLFRNLNFDSLLIPDRVYIKLGDNIISEDFYSFPEKIIINICDNNVDVNELVILFDVSESRLKKFVNAVEKANLYFGYFEILKELKKYFFFGQEDILDLLHDYEVLNRLIFNIDSENIVELFKDNDNNFYELYNKAKRWKRRKRTLISQQLDSIINNKDAKIVYSDNFVGISKQFIERKDYYQTYLSPAFEQMAKIVLTENNKQFYKKVCRFIDMSNSFDIKTEDLIFDKFLALSEKFYNENSYSYSLLIIKNAIAWSDMMRTKTDCDVLKVYIDKSIDGMITSYLSVASAALDNQNYLLANKYFAKLNKFYHKELKGLNCGSSGVYPKFYSKIIEIVTKQINKNNPKKALEILDYFDFIDAKVVGNYFYLLKSKAYTQLYLTAVDSIIVLLENDKLDKCYKEFIHLDDFKKDKKEYLKEIDIYNDKVNKTVYSLMLEFIQKGEISLDNKSSLMALKYLSKAKVLNNRFVGYNIPVLDSLMAKAALPVVNKKIEDANFKIWANRLAEAREIYNDVLNDIKKYHLGDISVIDVEVKKLSEKMADRKCVEMESKLNDYVVVVWNRVKSCKWDEAAEIMLKADKIVEEKGNCNLKLSDYKLLKEKYETAFNYVIAYNKMFNKLIAFGLDKVLNDFANLDADYYENNFESIGIKESGLYDLLENQGNIENIKKIVSIYLSEHDTRQALRYLNLLNDLNVTDKEVKMLLKETGKQMASEKDFKNDYKKIADMENKWFKPLEESYLENIN